MHYENWSALTDDELAKRDLAEISLAAAYDLPGAEDFDVAALLRKLDDWAELIDHGVRRSFKCRARGEHANYSANQFRLLVMITVLQRNLGLKYNRGFSEGEYDASDSRNLFIHGLLTGHGGTCVSMPVLYAALGRRLGYPLRQSTPRSTPFAGGTVLMGNVSTSKRLHRDSTPRPTSFTIASQGHCHRKICSTASTYGTSPHARNWRSRWRSVAIAAWTTCAALSAVEAYYHAQKAAPDNSAHHNHWGWAILIHRMVEQAKRQRQIGDPSTVIHLPSPRTDWEKRMYPVALDVLNRIMRNRRARQLSQRMKTLFRTPPCTFSNRSSLDVRSHGRPIPE